MSVTFETQAQDARKAACSKYYAGQEGPYVLEGTYTPAEFEALNASESRSWRMSFRGGKISLYGDSGDVHEQVTHFLAQEIMACPWDTHADTPNLLQGRHGWQSLFINKASTTCRWQPTDTVEYKEPDIFFRALETVSEESGLVMEVAHKNEPYTVLCKELRKWVIGQGERALVSVGVKIDNEAPYINDPRLRLVVAHHQEQTLQVFEFGRGSSIAPSLQCRDTSPPTPLQKIGQEDISGAGIVETFAPSDPSSTDLIVHIPIGAALFSDLTPDAYQDEYGFVLTQAFVDDLKQKQLALDLGHLRRYITERIRKSQH